MAQSLTIANTVWLNPKCSSSPSIIKQQVKQIGVRLMENHDELLNQSQYRHLGAILALAQSEAGAFYLPKEEEVSEHDEGKEDDKENLLPQTD